MTKRRFNKIDTLEGKEKQRYERRLKTAREYKRRKKAEKAVNDSLAACTRNRDGTSLWDRLPDEIQDKIVLMAAVLEHQDRIKPFLENKMVYVHDYQTATFSRKHINPTWNLIRPVSAVEMKAGINKRTGEKLLYGWNVFKNTEHSQCLPGCPELCKEHKFFETVEKKKRPFCVHVVPEAKSRNKALRMAIKEHIKYAPKVSDKELEDDNAYHWRGMGVICALNAE
jgi:hypothetical protein